MQNDIAEINEREKAITVGVRTERKEDFFDEMDELDMLVEALGLEVVGSMRQDLPRVNPATYLGKGKLEELAEYAHSHEASYVVFADTLSPAQLRNITEVVDTVVYDRTGLILEIFRRRAGSNEAKLQVEIAELKYMLPRLIGMRESLGRQAGTSGSGSNKGRGEKQLELDRRRIHKRISELEKDLENIEHNREVQRRKRNKSRLPQVSLVGYTNVGKSTLMNRLLMMTNSEEDRLVFEHDMLFATLDTSVRKICWDDNRDFLLSDTVGFVRELPHGLIQAFHSTLEEVKYADLLLLVVDATESENRKQIDVTVETLRELGADTIPRLTVMNKADLMDVHPTGYDEPNERVYISARTGEGVDVLVETIKKKIYGDNRVVDVIIPYSEGRKVQLLNDNARIISQEYLAEGVHIVADCPKWLDI